ncbi:Dynamin-type G domain-containing protein [Caenorhabditis elegans]|uniref:Dynamin-type G domain-containing protein n=1 Tax=Caenorhabditis elegans TaxID=6239 RepID=Q8WSP1_CAEEL|nr:Dynamin-type G domain-containing protein [Caenorhabditis elegans]CCD72162.1 Dynamin-type G domain-containing protein [Caenorhabditis elegans]|eukprot:NP_001024196.1 Receptor Mediated Endocytosis [Caenorhabditis elegans]
MGCQLCRPTVTDEDIDKTLVIFRKKSTNPFEKTSERFSSTNPFGGEIEEGQKKKKTRSMFSWLGGDSSKKKNKEVLETVSEGLRKIYKQKLLPLEEFHKFHDFHSPALDDPDFDAKPMILLVGQYSTGKTTFIRYLLESDFPGIRIGPEPTTDRFIAVMHGDEEGSIPGNALVVDAKKQFRALSGFGNAFLNRFQCSTLPNQVLESVTIVDTPGILSGEKQRIDRGYDFTGVLEWFAERVDRIILLFDAHKLDISDEFKRCIEALAGNEDKIRIVLNKSDMVDHQQLMRVYGALMWSLGKVFKTPEVSRVYLGSFWDHPLHYDLNRRLFQDEQHDLFQDLQALPRNAALRKLNDLIKRARLAKVHAYIIAELRKQMPSMIGKDKKKKDLIQNLDKIYEQLQREHNISPGDFPDVNKMREKLQTQDFSKFNPLKPKLLEVVDGMLATDIARLMAQIPKEEAAAPAGSNGSADPTVRGGAFSQTTEAETPFGFGRGEGFDKGADEAEWVVSRERTTADSTFESLGPVNGYLSGRAAKEHMVKSKLPNSVLGKVWKLADIDKDGQLDADEFALANYLINLKLEGHEIPSELPKHLIPPSKRGEQDPVYPSLNDNDE